MGELPRGAVLVRTWFGDDDAWDALLGEVQTPSEEGFLAGVIVVDDPDFAGLTAEGLVESHGDGAIVTFLADKTTLSNPEHPILAVRVPPLSADDESDAPPFRVIPSKLWSVENNINLANMDWEDFTSALSDDGVFRGFRA